MLKKGRSYWFKENEKGDKKNKHRQQSEKNVEPQ